MLCHPTALTENRHRVTSAPSFRQKMETPEKVPPEGAVADVGRSPGEGDDMPG